MAEIIFDSLKHTKDLEKAGVPTSQAEKHVEIMGKIINTHLATKDEIFLLRKDMDLLRKDFELAISNLRNEIMFKMSEGFKDQNNKMVAYFTIAVTVLSLVIMLKK